MESQSASQPVWTLCRTDKSLAPTGISHPDRPPCSLIKGGIKTKTKQKDSLASALYQPSHGTKIAENAKQYFGNSMCFCPQAKRM